MGCSGTNPPLVVDSFCQVDQPIGWSSHDTDQTIRDVKTHNRVYAGLCPDAQH